MADILIIGGNSQLAQSIRAAQFDAKTCIFLDRNELDITQAEKVDDAIDKYNVKFLVNCAAYTAVDAAETEKELAYLVNAKGAATLARSCRKRGISMIHISTDFVFDGEKNTPYVETDKVNPLGVYGSSKLEGERLAMEENPDTLIIRTSWLYSEFGKNFMKTMMRLGQERDQISVVSDQVGTPTYAGDLAKAILKIIHLPYHWTPGIYHYSNMGHCSWYDFAKKIMLLADLQCEVKPISSSEYPTAARRPKYSVLDKYKIEKQFKLKIPSWEHSLEKCIKKSQHELERP